jgi:hypothetical protein
MAPIAANMPQIAFNERKVRAVQRIYADSPAARTVLDYFATRDTAERETEIESLANRLVSLGRGQVLSVMRALQKLELGRVYQGRRGHKTRFVWAAPLNQVGLAAQGQLTTIDELEDSPGFHHVNGFHSEDLVSSNGHISSPDFPQQTHSEEMADIANTAALNVTINVSTISMRARAKLAELLMVLMAEDQGTKDTRAQR